MSNKVNANTKELEFKKKFNQLVDSLEEIGEDVEDLETAVGNFKGFTGDIVLNTDVGGLYIKADKFPSSADCGLYRLIVSNKPVGCAVFSIDFTNKYNVSGFVNNVHISYYGSATKKYISDIELKSGLSLTLLYTATFDNVSLSTYNTDIFDAIKPYIKENQIVIKNKLTACSTNVNIYSILQYYAFNNSAEVSQINWYSTMGSTPTVTGTIEFYKLS